MVRTILGRVFGKSIKVQLTVLLIGLAGIAIIVLGFIGIRAVLDSGGQAESMAGAAMHKRAEQFLVQTTDASAAKNSIIFQNVQHKSQNLAEYLQNVLDRPTTFPASHWRYDTNMKRFAGGAYGNSDRDPASVFVYKDATITSALKRELELATYLDFITPQMLHDEPNVVAAYFVGSQGESVYYPNIGLATVADPSFNPATAEFYTVADPIHNPKKTTQWTSVYDDPAGNGLLITASHPIYTGGGKTFSGIVGADVLLSNIAKNIEDYSPIESSYAFLIDNTGRAIALPKQGYSDILGRNPKEKEFGSDLTKPKGGFGTVLTAMRAGKQGFTITRAADGTPLYVAYEPVAGTNFSLAIVAKQAALLQVVSTMRAQVQDATQRVLYFQMLPAAAILFAVVWLAGRYYISRITNPIVALTEQTKRVQRGNFKQGVTVRSSNEIGVLAGAFNDMTAQLAASYRSLEKKVKELSYAKAKDEAILNGIGDGVIVTDPDGKALLVNGIATKLLGLGHATDVSGKLAGIVLYDEQGERLPADQYPLQVALATNKRYQRAVTIKRHGNTTVLSVIATPVIENGEVIAAIQILYDVTREKEIDRMKTEFISLASHQLRTPLSAIKWHTELLMGDDAGKLNTQQTEFLANIDASTDRMIQLVGALLNISRIESGRITVDPQPTDMRTFVSGIINGMQDSLKKRKQKVTLSIDDAITTLNIDPRLIAQVYLNLLTNASKYTPDGGKITMDIRLKGDEVISTVTDTGYGIPKTEHDKIFQKFFRASNAVKVETDGTGLGLYLARSVVESSNGRIWFESHEDKGTAFHFSLPKAGMQKHKGEVTFDF